MFGDIQLMAILIYVNNMWTTLLITGVDIDKQSVYEYMKDIQVDVLTKCPFSIKYFRKN